MQIQQKADIQDHQHENISFCLLLSRTPRSIATIHEMKGAVAKLGILPLHLSVHMAGRKCLEVQQVQNTILGAPSIFGPNI